METVSNTPWGEFKESDYSLEQWRRACLISPPEQSDAKADYKLPVREPSGTLNRAGCHSAAAALAGARGGVNASVDQKRSAAKRLTSLYRNQLEEDPPESLLRLAGESVQMNEEVEDFIAHYGVKGMRWGVRKSRTSSPVERSEDSSRAQALLTRPRASMSNKELRDLNERLQLEKTYSELTKQTTTLARGQRIAKEIIAVGGTVTAIYNLYNSPMGRAARAAIQQAFK